MRNRLIHEYSGVHVETVGEIVRTVLPALARLFAPLETGGREE